MALSTPVAAKELLRTSESWDGGAFSYPQGSPLVTSLVLELEEGQETPWHCHPVPTMGYVLEGSLEVETSTGKTVTLTPGESVVEVMRTMHRGRGMAGGARVVVFYAGATQIPVTVLADDAGANEHCTSGLPP